MKKNLKTLVVLLFAVIFVIAFSDWRTQTVSGKYIVSEISELPKTKVGLVLGTSKYIADGRRNLFYVYRLDAAKTLYDAGKIEYILVSGDNGTTEYNETDTMKTDLIEMWIPKENIYGDYAGSRASWVNRGTVISRTRRPSQARTTCLDAWTTCTSQNDVWYPRMSRAKVWRGEGGDRRLILKLNSKIKFSLIVSSSLFLLYFCSKS